MEFPRTEIHTRLEDQWLRALGMHLRIQVAIDSDVDGPLAPGTFGSDVDGQVFIT